MELFFYDWDPDLFVLCTRCAWMTCYTALPLVSQYSTDLEVVATRQDMLQCAGKVREEDCQQVNMDVMLESKY